ncbi:hypothetical protein [Vibrio agarivorans]|uniref:DUF1481 domain-containing protein n=1 Tax=Vibrio agarivorans TaxID=153622 RepID=A0ABT7Y7X4_9VIBR|nr:hypothetical protein [Vibrio agarivorans]MDN2483859.1 hypothetical protein [Vibrio agarivorans]
MKVLLLGVGLLVALAGCSVETHEDPYTCTTANVPGEDFALPVELYSDYYRDRIGYYQNGRQVMHSDCTAAHVVYEGSNITFEWFIRGAAINNKEGISSQRFYVDRNGLDALDVTRLPKNGVVIEESGPIERISRMRWQEYFGYVTVERNHELSSDYKLVADVGKNSKERRLDDNTQQWECIYRQDNSIVDVVAQCSNEAENDVEYLGVAIDSEPYLTAFDLAKRTYELDQDELMKDIDFYFR